MALLLLVCVILAPGTSLVTFVRCPSRARGMTCNILVPLPFYPHPFVFRVLRRRRTPYASGLAMHGLILAVRLHRGPICNILALSLPTSYRVVLATSLFSVARHITYFFFPRPVALLLFVCVLFWGAYKSLAPRARTLLGVLGQATLSFLVVATLLFFFFCECPKFCSLAKQRHKIFWGVSEVGKDDFSLYFILLCVFFLVLRCGDGGGSPCPYPPHPQPVGIRPRPHA